MVIIEQNISQVKYSNQEDKLNAINCYEKLVEKEADIISELKNLEITQITPLEAMNILFEYHNKVNE